jgi:hypothetical protein
VDFAAFVVLAAAFVVLAAAFVVVLAVVVLAAAIAVPVKRNEAAIIDASSFFMCFHPLLHERRALVKLRASHPH